MYTEKIELEVAELFGYVSDDGIKKVIKKFKKRKTGARSAINEALYPIVYETWKKHFKTRFEFPFHVIQSCTDFIIDIYYDDIFN